MLTETTNKYRSVFIGFVLTLILLGTATFGIGLKAPAFTPNRTVCGSDAVPPCNTPIRLGQSAHSHLEARVHLHLS